MLNLMQDYMTSSSGYKNGTKLDMFSYQVKAKIWKYVLDIKFGHKRPRY